MYDLDSARRAYRTDPLFRQLVDVMVHYIRTLHLTPADLRGTAMFAAVLYEERRPPSTVVLCPVCSPGRPCAVHQGRPELNVEPGPEYGAGDDDIERG